ncbi:Gfo/Idh/MocA family protein [Salisediminibacterium selenitireducens]|uniref:Oxidoreductase domain protein n=1 Tax=Bacillus selenitireducens (strain ATCC 700615 / DSM 15326 / MLS10) TaxID=439292 RepID=D6XZS1_BACIE|nr:Gfo/Idh/MocA family oxidoreductase [Salisediminibacterium selenitireducens]ADI00423.1 oxidoreductase domain protein [[Bacillus] selenitireducens MLS10]
MKPLQAGIIGCGTIAFFRHLPEYAQEEGVNIKAVCDLVEERADKYAKQYDAEAYTDFEKLLDDEEIDIVSICTPNALHAPMTIKALEKGKHVLCEKPMATGSEEAQAMIDAAEKSGKLLMIGHNQRFTPSTQKARELIREGVLGKVFSFRTTFGHGGPESWSVEGKNTWFFNKEKAFIGALGDLGVHKTDMIRYVLGEEFKEAGAMVETLSKEADVDDSAVCILKSESGIIGTMTASWTYGATEDNSTIIYGEKGMLRLEDDPTDSVILQYNTGERIKYELGGIQTNDADGQVNSAVIHQFVEAVRNNQPSPISGQEGKKSLEIILAALESNEKKAIVEIKS